MPKAKNPVRKSRYICEYCDKEFLFPSLLAQHRRVHTGERPFPCNLCSYSAAEKGSLQSHIKLHLHEKLFKCPEPLCNFSAVTKANLNEHRVVHAQEKPFSCPFSSCSYKTGRNISLTRHLRTHEENRAKPFQCELCPFKTTSRFQLRSHKPQVHSTEKKFKCEKEGCTFAAKTKSSLKIHLQTHEEKRLSCPHPTCGYRTNLKQGLKVHSKIHIHSEDKQYKCRICAYASHRSSSLVKHMRTHTKERPYKCQVAGCSFESAGKSGLDIHVRAVHQNVRPFQCPLCTYASAYKSHLKKHQLVRHSQSTSKMNMKN